MVSLIFWNKRANGQTRFSVIIATALTLIAAVALLTPAAYGNVGAYAFKNIDMNACLYVPAASIVAYRVAERWKDFKCIKDLASAPQE